MREDKKISVVVPVYNVEEYLERCVKSILNQTYTNLEVILVDDGSTDGSGRICDEFALSDTRIQAVHKSNEGVAKARETGIQLATGEYLGFVDSDDWIEPEMYESLEASMEDMDLVSSGCYKDYENSSTPVYDMLPEGEYINDLDMNYVLKNMLLFEDGNAMGIYASVCTKLFRTELLREVAIGLNLTIAWEEDMALTHAYLLRCRAICVRHKAFYHYYMRENSAMHSQDERFMEKIYQLYSVLRKIYRGHELENTLLLKLERNVVYLFCRGVNHQMGFHKEVHIPWYQLPFRAKLESGNIVLYGAGEVGQDYYMQMKRENPDGSILWVDKNYKLYQKTDMDVLSPEKLKTAKYDWVLIAVKYETMAEEIKKELRETFGVSEAKMLWSETQCLV